MLLHDKHAHFMMLKITGLTPIYVRNNKWIYAYKNLRTSKKGKK